MPRFLRPRRSRRPRWAPAAARRARERGAEALQFAVIGAPLAIIVFGVIQLSLFAVTSMQTSSAAQVGVQAARAQTGSLAQGAAAAADSIRHIGIAEDIAVSGSRTDTDATITVTARTPSLIPFFRLPAVVSSAHGPVERVTTVSGEFTNSEGFTSGN